MNSHYFIGIGPFSESFRSQAGDLSDLSRKVSGIIREVGLEVMSENITGFSEGGSTLVWVLAESHVAMHYWNWEGFVTIDIHVCDYTSSNAEKALRLKERLEKLCFVEGSAHWAELVLPHPARPVLQPVNAESSPHV